LTYPVLDGLKKLINPGIQQMRDKKTTAFLGTQGDIWDTQWDIFLAMCGAIISQLILGRTHDKALDRMSTRKEQA